MKTITLMEVKNGMKLASEVKDSGGRILFAKGQILDGQTIQTLMERGIHEIPIEVSEAKQGNKFESIKKRFNAKTEEELIENIKIDIESRFKQVQKNPILLELKRIVTKVTLKNILKLKE